MDVKRFSRDTILTLGGRTIGFAAGILVNIIIARTVGPIGKGIATLVLMYPTLSYQILNAGLENASTYYVSRERKNLSSLIGNMFFHAILISLIFLAFSFLNSNWITNTFFKTDIYTIFLISVIIFPLLPLLRIIEAIFVGLKSFGKYNLLMVIELLGRLPFAFLIFIILKQHLIGCAYFQIFPIFCAFIIAIFLLLRKAENKINLQLSLYKKSIIYGVKSQAGVMITQFNYRLDHFLIASLRSLPELGLYSMGVLATEILWFIPESLSKVFFPRVASLSSQEEIRKNAALLLSTTFWILIIISFFIVFLGKYIIIALLGTKFLQSYTVILLLLPGTIMLSIGKISSSVFHGLGKPEFGTYIAVVGIILTVILDLLLIPKLGIYGAAIASSIAYSMMGITGLIFLIWLIGGSIQDYLFIKPKEIRKLIKLIWKR